MTLVYATVEEATREVGLEVLPEDERKVLRLLRIASGAVRLATRAAYYDTTPAGAPSDPDVADAFRDATLGQVRVICESGLADEVLSAGVKAPPRLAKSTMNGASVDLDYSEGDAARADLLAGRLAPESEQALLNLGLLSGQPSVRWAP